MQEFYSLLEDKNFKAVFRQELYAKDLVNSYYAFLHIPKRIDDATIIQTQSNLVDINRHNKGLYADVLMQEPSGEYTILEAYTRFGEAAYNKSSMYAARVFSTQQKPGQDYNDLKNVNCLNFMTGNFRRKTDKLINRGGFGMMDDEVHYPEFMKMDLIRVDLSKDFDYNDSDKRFIRWLKLMNAKSMEEMESIAEGDDVFMKLVNFLKKYMENKREEKAELDFMRQQGIEEGEAIGESNKQKAIATNMLKKNYKVREIQELTGLSASDIKKLKTEVTV